jgi:uncharacterized membrane protein (DUF485 family)
MFLLKRQIKTDDEFVCMIRKRIKISRKVAIFQFITAFILLVVISWFSFKVFLLTPVADSEETIIWFGFFVGTMCGAFFGLMAVQTGHFLFEAITSFTGNRQDKLLIKYYDALKELTEGKNG